MADYSTRIFDDPDGAIKELKKEIIQEVSGLYVQAEGTKAFWNEFYQKHEDLKPARRVVEGVLQENLPRLANSSVPDAIREIATLSRKELQQLRSGITVEPSRRSDRSLDDQDREIAVGGPDHGSIMTEGVPAPNESLGDVIRARRAAQRSGPGVRLRNK